MWLEYVPWPFSRLLVREWRPGWFVLEGKAAKRTESRHGEFGNQKVEIGNETRTYRLVVPKTVDLSKPASLVVAFHGMLIDSKDVMPKYTRLNETAEAKKFIIAYPRLSGKAGGSPQRK